MLTVAETMIKEPLIRTSGLKGGGYYVEYRTDDARLTIEVIKTAFEKGAIACNYTKIEELVYKNNKICGAVAKDLISGETSKIRAKKVVNAAGPWVVNNPRRREINQIVPSERWNCVLYWKKSGGCKQIWASSVIIC
ncbi:FAD-dependent oxidoreductase [Bacillus sp. ISL-18]|uniref:FAD-dependent oxidoreductase n=1 Tax=Bacillus sp. ISL-18 TaxID=2819118 RepID=UPI001BE62562|nr:FAD-dependent oxidoreductase [Bacillus sp. ISL-18]MBT2654155.1 FAD-dependent oxidoreductase [Bacillus sp. ISL-18]